MPSLRHTTSSPNVRAVRAAPYSSATRAGHTHRRSGGSDTSSRRILADLSWWEVADGQTSLCDNVPTTTTVTNDENQFYVALHEPRHEDFQVNHDIPTRPSSPFESSANTFCLPTPPVFPSHTSEFGVLSCAPRAAPLNIRRHTFPLASTSFGSAFEDESFSSVESSPEITSMPLTPMTDDGSSFDMNFADDYFGVIPSPTSTPQKSSPHKAFLCPASQFSDFEELSKPLFGFGISSTRISSDDVFN